MDGQPPEHTEIEINKVGTFLYCSPFSYCSSNFAIAKLSFLIPLLQFLYKFCRLVHGFFSVLLPIQLSLFYVLKGDSVE